MSIFSRRSFLASAPAVAAVAATTTTLHAGVAGAASAVRVAADAGDGAHALSWFPTQDPDLVREMVTVAHFDLARVKELVGRQQTLAKAGWDWGFGDWETALGAASHTGRREIAELLLANGARPTLFSAAMLGQLEVVKAFVAASPGVQRIKGPHSITLLRHAMAGGAQAKPVLDYLTALGGADDRITEAPLTSDQRTKLAGSYACESLGADHIEISISKESLQFARNGRAPRGLMHVGSFEFCPVGAENVRIRFVESGSDVTLTVHDPDVVLTAVKTAASGISPQASGIRSVEGRVGAGRVGR